MQSLTETVTEATRTEQSWQAKLDAGVSALLGFLDEHGDWAQLVVLEAPVSGLAAVRCTELAHNALLTLFEQARETVIVAAQIEPPPKLIAELLVLACLSLIRSQILKADGQPLSALAPLLSSEIIEPYLGQAAAKLDNAAKGAPAQLTRRAEMVPLRPHPRTVPALSVIASAPGLNSGQVGHALGIENSGHISGLLRRFERRGLIENAGARQNRRGPRAWFLTPYGQRILEILTNSFSRARWLEVTEQAQASV